MPSSADAGPPSGRSHAMQHISHQRFRVLRPAPQPVGHGSSNGVHLLPLANRKTRNRTGRDGRHAKWRTSPSFVLSGTQTADPRSLWCNRAGRSSPPVEVVSTHLTDSRANGSVTGRVIVEHPSSWFQQIGIASTLDAAHKESLIALASAF